MVMLFENKFGVRVDSDSKINGHYMAVGATCHCGEELVVAPPIFQADHRPCDPVFVCRDHGMHAFRFSELVLGVQPTPTTLE